MSADNDTPDRLAALDDLTDVPHCPYCLAPFHPLQHYCPNCWEAVGRYTRTSPL